jgi:hypothetical protein
LAFSNPDASKVFFFIVSANGAELSQRASLDLDGHWVVFSPDGRFAAIQTASNGGKQASLVLVSTASFERVKTIPLGNLLNDRLFVTAWVN